MMATKAVPRPAFVVFGQLRHFYKYFGYFIRCFFLFKRPLRFLACYLFQRLPQDRLVELKDGLKIFLSDHPSDIATVFIIFGREEYGKVRSSGAVVDVGANIGVFSLYAARAGSKRVDAYEPNQASFSVLARNVVENQFENRILTHRFAVTGKDGQMVKFPKASNPTNAILTSDRGEPFELVPTTTLEAIVKSTGRIDLLKMDCEGVEYEILYNTSASSFEQIGSIFLEYHNDKVEELTSFLNGRGFEKKVIRKDSDLSGIIWVTRAENRLR